MIITTIDRWLYTQGDLEQGLCLIIGRLYGIMVYLDPPVCMPLRLSDPHFFQCISLRKNSITCEVKTQR